MLQSRSWASPLVRSILLGFRHAIRCARRAPRFATSWHLTRCGISREHGSFGSTGRMDLGREGGDHLPRRTVFFARETLPRRKKNNWGRFINITSAAVKQPADGLLLSNSMRASVRSAETGLTRTPANEYASDGIAVNNACPGYTRTARLDRLAESISTRTNANPDGGFAVSARAIPQARIRTTKDTVP